MVKSFIFLIPVSVNEEGEDIYTLESIQLFVSSACDLYFRDEDLKKIKSQTDLGFIFKSTSKT